MNSINRGDFLRKLLEVEERGCVANFIARAKAIAKELHPNRIIDNTKLVNFKSDFKKRWLKVTRHQTRFFKTFDSWLDKELHIFKVY